MTPSSAQRTAARPDKPRRRRPWAIIAVALAAILAAVVLNAWLVSAHTSAATGTTLVKVEGGEVNVVQDGATDAPALVLVHGLGGSTRWWDPVVPSLAASYHVIRVDLLGFGRSAKPGGALYSIPAQGRRIGEVLDHLGITQAVLVGHSTGGSVVTALAEQRPSLVNGIVLVDAGPRLSDFVSNGVVGNLVSAPVLGQLLWRLQSDSLVRRAMSSAFSRRGFTIPQKLVDDTRATTYHALHATDAASTAYIREHPLPDRLRRLRKPLLVIFGQDDHRWHSSAAQEYRVVPGTQIHVLTGIGHSPMQEDPADTTQLIDTFAGTVSPS